MKRIALVSGLIVGAGISLVQLSFASEPAPAACAGKGCAQFDQPTAQAISAHLNDLEISETVSKYELVGLRERTDCVPGPKSDKPVPQVRWYDRLNPVFWIGNADDPVAPEWYRPGNPLRNVLWYFRNPFHNLTFYVIGVGDKLQSASYSRCGPHPKDVFAPEGGWNFSVIKYKGLRLPFVSYWNRHTKLYLGWRERGNIGIKVNISTKGKYKTR